MKCYKEFIGSLNRMVLIVEGTLVSFSVPVKKGWTDRYYPLELSKCIAVEGFVV